MKSRLEVSLLFILIASTFVPGATGAFRKFRALTGKVAGRCAVLACHRHSPNVSARMTVIKGPDNGNDQGKDRVAMIRHDGGR